MISHIKCYEVFQDVVTSKKSGKRSNEPCEQTDNLVDQFGEFVLVNQIVVSAFLFPSVYRKGFYGITV